MPDVDFDSMTLWPTAAGGLPFARQYIECEVSIRYFRDGQPCAIEKALTSNGTHSGEYIVRRADGAWIRGEEC